MSYVWVDVQCRSEGSCYLRCKRCINYETTLTNYPVASQELLRETHCDLLFPCSSWLMVRNTCRSPVRSLPMLQMFSCRIEGFCRVIFCCCEAGINFRCDQYSRCQMQHIDWASNKMIVCHTCHIPRGCLLKRGKCLAHLPCSTLRHRSMKMQAAAEFAVNMDELEDSASKHA